MTVHGGVISHVNISHVMVEDGGEYSCTAENRAGKVTHAARLNVYGKFHAKFANRSSSIMFRKSDILLALAPSCLTPEFSLRLIMHY